MKIFEVGVGEYWQSRTSKYINTDVECWLFEPNPISFSEIYKNLSTYKNFKLFNCALGSQNKKIKLNLAKGASFIEGINAPIASKKDFQKVEVEMKSIREFDNGDIDVLLLDIEGGEFDVLKSLLSRPKHIVVEMFSFGVNYVNPYFDEIVEWMNRNNYILNKKGNIYSLSPWPDPVEFVGDFYYSLK